MAKFKEKMAGKKTIGNKIINSDEAMGLVFKDTDKKVTSVKISALKENPYQPRKTMNEQELQELAESIEQNGLLQPIIISSINNSPKEFHIIAGHRRVEAHKLLKKEEIEAIILKTNQEQLQIYALLENMQRENLSILEEAKAVYRLLEYGISQNDIAKKLGRNKAYVSKVVKIAQLSNDVVAYIEQNNVNVGISILYELAKQDEQHQLQAIKYINKKSLSRDEIVDYLKCLSQNGQDTDREKSFPVKLSSFSFKEKKDKYSIKIDLNNIKDEERNDAIKKLETLLNHLKYNKKVSP